MTARMKVGDTLWRASAGPREKWVTCDVCAGQKRITVILGSGEHVSIDCGGCDLGFDPPSGRIKVWEYDGDIRSYRITGLEIVSDEKGERVRYRSGTESSYYTFEEEDCFPSAEAAQARCAELIAEHEASEAKRLLTKEKPDRSYAWNAAYHLREAKRHRQQVVYHEQKAVVMKAKDKSGE